MDPLKSFIAGGTAGAVEGIITYPFEFAKTRLQLISKSSTASRNPLVLIYNVAKTQGVSSLYVGCPAFVVGNTLKASVRFLGFDLIKIYYWIKWEIIWPSWCYCWVRCWVIRIRSGSDTI